LHLEPILLGLDPYVEVEAAKIRAEWDEVTEWSRRQIREKNEKGKDQKIRAYPYYKKVCKVISDED